MPSTKTLPGDLLTPEQVAETLNLDTSTVYAKLRAGEIPFVELAKRALRIRRVDLEAFIWSRLRGSISAAPGTAPTSSRPQLAEYWSRPARVAERQGRKGASR